MTWRVHQISSKNIVGAECPGEGIRSLAREINVGVATVKLALNEDLHYHFYKRHKGQLLISTSNHLKKAKKKASEQAEISHRTRDSPLLY